MGVSNPLSELALLVYPVGAYYWSSEPTDPSQLFGGTWEQIKDRFVLAAGDTYTAGDVGGAEEHLHGAGNLTAALSARGSSRTFAYVEKRCEPKIPLPDDGKAITTTTVSLGTLGSRDAESLAIGTYVIGDSASASTMPPYIVAYCWRRTA